MILVKDLNEWIRINNKFIRKSEIFSINCKMHSYTDGSYVEVVVYCKVPEKHYDQNNYTTFEIAGNGKDKESAEFELRTVSDLIEHCLYKVPTKPPGENEGPIL